MVTINKCRAKDPSTCPYHGAILRADAAVVSGDFDAYDVAMRDVVGNSIPKHWKNAGNSGLSEVQWRAAQVRGLHPGVLEVGVNDLVHIRKTKQTLEGYFDSSNGDVFYKQNGGVWWRYPADGSGPKGPDSAESPYIGNDPSV